MAFKPADARTDLRRRPETMRPYRSCRRATSGARTLRVLRSGLACPTHRGRLSKVGIGTPVGDFSDDTRPEFPADRRERACQTSAFGYAAGGGAL
jgi:hypothetical protein